MQFLIGGYLPEALRMRGTTVLVQVHAEDCVPCRTYVSQLGASAEEFRVWEAALRVVPGQTPGVVVADRFGQVFAVQEAGAGHEFMPVRELEEWLKYLGTLCPE